MNKKDKQIVLEFKKKVSKGEAFYSEEKQNPETYKESLKNKVISHMIRIKRELEFTNKELSHVLEMTESQTSKMLAYHIDEFSLDFLIDKLEMIDKYQKINSLDILKKVA